MQTMVSLKSKRVVKQPFVFSDNNNGSVKYCLVCHHPVLTTTANEDTSLLKQLYVTLELSAVFSSPVNDGIENTEFCGNCSSALVNSSNILEQMEKLKKDLEEIRQQLKMCVTSTYHSDGNNVNQEYNNNTEELRSRLVRKTLVQCMTGCKVKLVSLSADDLKSGSYNLESKLDDLQQNDLGESSPVASDIDFSDFELPPQEINETETHTLPVSLISEDSWQKSPEEVPSSLSGGTSIGVKRKSKNRPLPKRISFPFPCKHCCRRFETWMKLNQHFQDYHSESFEQTHEQIEAPIINEVQSETFEIIFKSECNFASHNEEMNFIAGVETVDNTLIIPEENNSNFLSLSGIGNLQDQPDQCDLRHMVGAEVTVESDCSVASDDFPNSNLPKLNKSNKVYACSKCNRKFQTREYYLAHQNLHLGIYPFSCEFCEQKFLLGSKLNRHIRTFHTTNYGYVRGGCTDGTGIDDTDDSPLNKISSENTSSNKTSVKAKKKPVKRAKRELYKCEECDKSYQTREYFIAHQYHHRGIYPFHCNFCSQKFILGSKLNKHIRDHHAGTQLMVD